MPPLILLFTLSIVGTIAGAIYAYRLIVTARQAGQRSDTLRAWSEMPLPSWRHEPHSTIAILIHTLAALGLGFVALRAASNDGILSSPLFANDAQMIVLVWFIQCGSILMVGFHIGSLLITFPLTVFRREPVALAITEQGVIHGRNTLPWHWFSHFAVDSEAGMLILYSPFSPDLPTLISKPPKSVSLVELGDTMHAFLPSHPSVGRRAWFQQKFYLVPTMILVCLSIIALGWLASSLQRELALFLMALLMVLLIFLGGKVLSLFAFGVLTTRVNSQRQPPAA